jgi:signal transduction histidine kinase/ligand-binding sensor domain-containing protein
LKKENLQGFVIFFLFFVLVSFSAATAQPKRLQFVQLTSDDGLSSSIVSSLLQDYEGLLWIGTPYGLNRYDGFNFVYYKNNPADSCSLIDNVITTIFEDREKNLFIGTENGLSLYDREKDCFRNYMSDKTSPLNGINCSVRKIQEDKSGNLWLATDAGLIYFDRKKNISEQFTNNREIIGSLSDNNVESVLIDSRGRLWITNHKDIELFKPENRTFIHMSEVTHGSPDLAGIVFRNIVEDKEGNIWIGSRGGLFCFKDFRDNMKPEVVHYSHNSQNINSLSIDMVNSLFVDDEGNIWIGTENGGLNLFNAEKDEFWRYRKDDYDPQSLNNESIEAICQDNSGNLWFGTYSGGLNIALKNRNAIAKYQNLPGVKNSLSHNSATCFREDHQRKLWIGTDGGGLNLFDEQAGRFKRFNIENSGLSSNSVLCIFEDSKQRIWIGTWSGGLVRFDPISGKFHSYTTKNSGIQDNNIFTIEEGFDDDLWLGSFEHGLIHYQIAKNEFNALTPENSKVGNAMVIKIVKFTDQRLLLGTTENFQIFSPSDNHFLTYAYDQHKTDAMSYSRVTDILIENDSSVWIGTPKGLNQFNPIKGSFKRFYVKDGLPDDFIKGITMDSSGFLWITTGRGVCRFNYKTGSTKNFTKADGLQSNEFLERSIFKARSGNIYMGGGNGFNIVYPEKIVENRIVPNILITDLKIFNKSIQPGVKNSPLVRNITETRELTLTHDNSVLTFSFAIMDFSAPEKNRSAYMMENFDKDWISADNKHEVTYTNLNPGNYIFRVKGSNNDGLWNNEGTSIHLTILPPWWATLWFRLTFIILFLLIFSFFFISRERQLNSRRIQLEKLVEAKTIELKELNASKDKFFSIIAHDLKNPFSTIIGFSELLREQLENGIDTKPKEYARAIQSSALQTFRLLENLLEWANTQRGKISFNPENINLEDLIYEELKVLRETATGKGIELRCVIPENLNMNIFADKNMIRTIIRNLISNAIKFTNRKGKVIVNASTEDGIVKISVADNGIGMTPDTLSKLFKIDSNLSTRGTEDEKGTGLGLCICRDFVEKHNGEISVESTPGNGSIFRISLPRYA